MSRRPAMSSSMAALIAVVSSALLAEGTTSAQSPPQSRPAPSRVRQSGPAQSGPGPASPVNQLQQLTGALPQGNPGPLELSARAITAENPIPRRVHVVVPIYPPEAAAIDAAAVVTVRVTVDVLGRVAEVRTDRPMLGASKASTLPGSASMPAVLDALTSAARSAAAQWIYEPPADGPVSFDVPIRFRPDGDPEVGKAVIPRYDAAQDLATINASLSAEPLPPWAEGAVPVQYLIRAPSKTRDVRPIYPDAALQAGITGVVIVQTRVEPDGTIRNARVLRSVPALDQAALDAILQWEFAPSLVNGQAIPVLMTVTVQFSL